MTFPALLAARAHAEGRAQPSALVRHRALAQDPLCIVGWKLGAEDYSVGAIAIGRQAPGYSLFVPGYPLDRHLLFASLVGFAREFCTTFESFAQGPRSSVRHMGADLEIPNQLPQIVVPNTETVALLGRLGRRLAYLPTTGEAAANPLLPRLGRHLMWLVEYAQLPGQQLIVPLADLLAQHYVTAMSSLEMQSLSAMDAWIEPPVGKHGFQAAEKAETLVVGPVPSPADAKMVHTLMKALNEKRNGSHDPLLVSTLARPLHDLYDRMVQHTWSLMWRVIDRERRKPEATSVSRRAFEDRIEYATHMQWMNGAAEGRRKTRMTPRRAAMWLDKMERAKTMLEAEEATDDPLRMAPHLLAGKAIAGEVVNVDESRRELIGGKRCRRPSVVVRSIESCTVPLGTDLWWTEAPAGKEWRVTSVTATPTGGSDVTLILQTNRMPSGGLPSIGSRECFSQLTTQPPYELFLPSIVPWTHQSAAKLQQHDDLESSAGSDGQAA